MKVIEVEIKGLQPLLMHSSASVDPTNPLVRRIKELTGKGAKKRTSADDEEIDRLSFMLALYHDGERVFVPDMAVLGTIRDAARKVRMGKESEAAVDVLETAIPLIFDGPQSPDELYEKRFVDRRPAGVQKARVMRVRPRFNAWGLRFTLIVDERILDLRRVRSALDYAGERIGLLDFRPRFGRFEVTGWKEQS